MAALPIEQLSDVLTKDMQKVYDKYAKVIESLWDDVGYNRNNEPLKITVQVTKGNGGYPENPVIRLRLNDGDVLKFELKYYDYCCAMVQCNGFTYNNILPKEFIHEVMDALFISMKTWWYKSFQRVVFNFVEPQRGREHQYGTHYSYGQIPEEPTNRTWIAYQHLYTWATSKRHQQLLTVNHNTNNIIHFVDCMWTLPA